MRKFFLLAMVAVFLLASCSKEGVDQIGQTPENDAALIKIGALKGPTALGLVELLENNELGKSANEYEISISGAPDEIVGKLTSGEIDVACLPTNLAAALYNKTGGKIKLAALNTLGVLYIVENGDSIKTLSDLKGVTMYATGQGATPEYVLNHILKLNGLDDDVEVIYKAEHSELAALLLAGQAEICMLPEPFVTNVLMKNEELKLCLNLNEEWGKVEENSVISMGCLVVRDDFLENNKGAFDMLLNEYEKSTLFVNENILEASALSEKFDIMQANVCEKAIPNCNIVFIKGKEMKEKIVDFYNVLYEAEPKSIGGTLPDDAFYYIQ